MRFASLPVAALLLGLVLPFGAMGQTTAELDAYWTEVSRTVAEGDFDGYAALYHDDAVVVSEASGTSTSIRGALEGWQPGFVETREGRMAASVEFRLTQRLNDAETAHETGIFRYTSRPDGGQESVGMVHFTALLVKKDGRWLMVMEYQGEAATEAEWVAAG